MEKYTQEKFDALPVVDGYYDKVAKHRPTEAEKKVIKMIKESGEHPVVVVCMCARILGWSVEIDKNDLDKPRGLIIGDKDFFRKLDNERVN